MQDLSRLFGHNLDRYDIRHSQLEIIESIDHTRFPLCACDSVKLEGSKSELVVMVEFKIINDGRLAAIREVRPGKDYENRVFEFEVNGSIHGKKLL